MLLKVYTKSAVLLLTLAALFGIILPLAVSADDDASFLAGIIAVPIILPAVFYVGRSIQRDIVAILRKNAE